MNEKKPAGDPIKLTFLGAIPEVPVYLNSPMATDVTAPYRKYPGLHHLIAFAPDPCNAIVLSGFQAGGTRGASLASGAKSICLYGEEVTVNAEVVQLTSASEHADGSEILSWLRSAPKPPRRVFITHGEPEAAEALSVRIDHELHWDAHVPDCREVVDLRKP